MYSGITKPSPANSSWPLNQKENTMKNYEVNYLSGPDDIFIKVFMAVALSESAAIIECKDNRDVHSIVSVFEAD
jgi:hypothetical protein